MDRSMETTNSRSNGEDKPVCQCATKSGVQRWLPGFPIALCLLMSLSSITVCVLMSFRTHQLENRLHMEMDKASILQAPQRSFKNEDGALISELSAPVRMLVEEKVAALMPKLRTARDVGQECSCPPGTGLVSASKATGCTGFTFTMYEVVYEEGILWRQIQVALLLYAAGGDGDFKLGS
ncbi:hypothetical protein CHARACLAT_009437 [Characodon lateralis]|uniref:Uncharacterized protein n=1 Tax=Characodon lateralis TaxID=208331 RepID=A0ABU7EI83_9TELE|nr:hypothetical protein [Characodon lateralis]